ncbi:kelch-like protein [Cystobacter fuscus]|nr:kelch-like protein [Cystobacter fuscus]
MSIEDNKPGARPVNTRAAVVALACLGMVFAPTASSFAAASAPSAKSWTFASYNIAAYDYSKYYVNDVPQTAADVYKVENYPEARYMFWGDFDGYNGGKRSNAIISRIKDTMNFDGQNLQADVVAVQESGTSKVIINGTHTTQREHLDARLRTYGYQQAVDYSKYLLTGDPITITSTNEVIPRTVARASHIYYNTSTLKPIASGTFLGGNLIDPKYRDAYLNALGRSFVNKDSVKKDKVFPWAILMSTGPSTDQPNRYIIVSSIHSIVDHGYSDTTDGVADFFNGEVARGLAKALKGISASTMTDGVAHPPGAPIAIIGDMNAYYKTKTGQFPGGNTEAKSVPRLLHDYGLRDARGDFFKETSECTTASSLCLKYHTFNTATNSGNVLDYIFTLYSGSTTNVGDFQTVADPHLWSDHKMIAARLKFGPLPKSSWATSSAMQSPRGVQGAALLSSGLVLVTGGHTRNSLGVASSISLTELYNPYSNTWQATGALNSPRYNFATVKLASGKILVSGGRNDESTLSSAELYDPVTRSWSYTGSLSQRRSGHQATLLRSGKVLVTGGEIENLDGSNVHVSPATTAELYDPETGAWSPAGELEHDSSGSVATMLYSGEVLLITGSQVDLYDPYTNRWSQHGALPGHRDGFTVTRLYSGEVMVVGGDSSNSTPGTTFIYNPYTTQWRAGPTMNRLHRNHTATLLYSGQLLIAGGVDGGTEVYDPETNEWTLLDNIPASCTGGAAILLHPGSVLLTAGWESSTVAPIFTP